MFTKTRDYIINLKSVNQDSLELVGHTGIELTTVLNAGIVMPDVFMLSSLAFDDFIAAADIVDKISAALATVTVNDASSASKAADKIAKYIEQSNYPTTISAPIISAYRNISGLSEKYVAVKPSWVLDEQITPKDSSKDVKLNVKGEAALLYAIKQSWISLFSPEALMQRAKLNYTSSLSIAVIVQRMVQSEVSGKLFSKDTVTGADSIMEINAVLGIDLPDQADFIQPDIYKFDLRESRIIEKIISQQQFMFLRKGRARPDEEPNMKIGISTEWRTKQKLSDRHITELVSFAEKLKMIKGEDIELHWGLEAGKLYVVSVKKQETSDYLEIIVPETIDTYGLPNIEDLTPAIKPEEISEVLIDEIPESVTRLEHEAPKRSEPPDISSLVKEVEQMVELPALPDTMVRSELVKSPELSYDLLTEIILDVSSQSSEQLTKLGNFDGAYLDGTQMLQRGGVLPESVVDNKITFSKLVDAYSQELASLSKLVNPNSLFYSFSDVDDATRLKLLGNAPPERGLDGVERFISVPESITAEALAIKSSRSNYNSKNLKLILPHLRSRQEILAVKRTLNSYSLAHSASLQVYAEISTPAFMFDLINVEPTDIDGIIINFPKLAEAMTMRKGIIEHDLPTIFVAIQTMLDFNNKKKFKCIIRCEADPDLVDSLMVFAPSAFIFTTIPKQEVFRLIKRKESEHIQLINRGRGRPRKSLM